MAITPPTSSSQSPRPGEKSLMMQVIENVLVRLPGQIVGIEAEEILDAKKQPDRDHNHKLIFEIKPGEKEPASLFALRLNGKPKAAEEAVKELLEKVKNHLENRENPKMIKLSSGNMILPETDVSIGEKDGYLCVDGKIIVIKKTDDKYMPLPGRMVQTYTSSRFFQEEDGLVILLDHHEKLRDDRKEGFIFNPNRPLKLESSQLESVPKHEGEYLILYRTREDARSTS